MQQGNLTIRMMNAMEELDSEFRSMYTRKDFEDVLKKLDQAGSDRDSVLAELFEMFDVVGISYPMGKDNAFYHKLVKEAELPNLEDLEEQMLLALYDRFEDYPTPEEYLKRTVDRLEDPADCWREQPLRLRILKQFLKYGNGLKDFGVRGEAVILPYLQRKGAAGADLQDNKTLALLEDDVFDLLAGTSKDDRKLTGKYGLLKLVDDLARGAFRAEGATRRSLYLFAIVYGMTYYSGMDDEVIDYERDIEKNLFTDFYVNNIMRFVTETYQGNQSQFLQDPGYGINYKNAAEMIFLYYITQPELTRAQRLHDAAEMFKRFKKRAADAGEKTRPVAMEPTSIVKGRVFVLNSRICTTSVLRESPEEFENFLVENYRWDTKVERDGKTVSIGEMMVGAAQNSAYAVYQELLGKLESVGIQPEDCNYGLWLTDVNSYLRKDLRHALTDNRTLDQDKVQRLVDLLLAVNRYVGRTIKEKPATQKKVRYQLDKKGQPVDPERDEEEARRKELSAEKDTSFKTPLLFLERPEDMTRTAILVAYYYYFNEYHLLNKKMQSFPEVFRTFGSGIGPYLERAGYQPFSGKNLLDLILAFSSYAYIHL